MFEDQNQKGNDMLIYIMYIDIVLPHNNLAFFTHLIL